MTRRRPPATVPVVCRDCGKLLKGLPFATRPGRFHVRRHKTPAGAGCLGHFAVDHRPAPPA